MGTPDLALGAPDVDLDTPPAQEPDGLSALQSVPLSFLLPDPDLLPDDSARLFRIDPGWIDALRDGVTEGMAAAPLSPAAGAQTAAERPEAGAALLVHSHLVEDGTEFDLTATRAGIPVTELSRHRPAPDVLICLFDAVPDTLTIREPGEGIHFGLDTADNPTGLTNLRR
ncbi:hypothetical protein NE236_34035 [Actinoallomurus purpureus]|uniref:hypothetical protein n=1 Tax=Actinoallomurus purpureus TaxID=478114 RepID=UPI00209379C1|nr:hypothetical protein [Actinoallomurus purpureus]MCO6010002.1 hypothetical protein [Actinoallomurus purpureus]